LSFSFELILQEMITKLKIDTKRWQPRGLEPQAVLENSVLATELNFEAAHSYGAEDVYPKI